MSRLKILPPFKFPDTIPTVYDRESKTCIEMCAKVYGAMRELQIEYEKFVNGFIKSQDEFEANIIKIVHDFIHCVDTKIDVQNSEVKKAIDYMVTNLPDTVRNLLIEMFESKELTIDFTYNETTESLDLMGVVVHERSGE